MRVQRSGRFASLWARPVGSFFTGMPAALKARLTYSFKEWCLTTRLGACLHTKPCVLLASTELPHLQKWRLPSSEPSLIANCEHGLVIKPEPAGSDRQRQKSSCHYVSRVPPGLDWIEQGCSPTSHILGHLGDGEVITASARIIAAASPTVRAVLSSACATTVLIAMVCMCIISKALCCWSRCGWQQRDQNGQ